MRTNTRQNVIMHDFIEFVKSKKPCPQGLRTLQDEAVDYDSPRALMNDWVEDKFTYSVRRGYVYWLCLMIAPYPKHLPDNWPDRIQKILRAFRYWRTGK